MNEVLEGTLSSVFLTVLVGVLTLLSAWVSCWLTQLTKKLKAQTMSLQDEETRKVLLQALEDAERLARTTVTAVEQTAAGAIRNAVTTGTADKEDLLKLGWQALEHVKAQLAPQAKQVITKNLGNLDDYLKDLIEAEVYRLKQHAS